MTDNEIEEAVDAMMTKINNHKAAGSGVDRSVSIAFYEGIADRCKEYAETIKAEDSAEDE